MRRRAYRVGRTAEAGRRIAAECLALCPRGDFRFVECGDLALLAAVDEACAEIASAESRRHADAPDEDDDGEGSSGGPRIDYLMMSHAGAVFQPRRGSSGPFPRLSFSRALTRTPLPPFPLVGQIPKRASTPPCP